MDERFTITPLTIKRVMTFRENGMSIREIARRMLLAPSSVHRIINGKHHFKRRFHRCKECGAVINSKQCLFCALKKQLDNKKRKINKKTDSEIKLELKKPEQERYEYVRKEMLARIDREAEARLRDIRISGK